MLPGPILLNYKSIVQVETTKFLGIHIDNKLTWKTHVIYISKLISRNTRVIGKLKISFPSHVLFTLYTTLIHPYLNYGIMECRIDQILLLQ